MKNIDLLNAMGGLSDELVADAAPGRGKKKSRWPAWSAAAACVCLIAAGGAVLGRQALPGPNPDPGPDGPAVQSPALPSASAPGSVGPAVDGEVPTSDRYGSLSQLLAYLGEHDDHTQDNKGGGGGSLGDGQTAVAAGGYAYCLTRTEEGAFLQVSDLERGGEPVFSAALDAQALFLWGDRLAAVGHDREELSLDDPGQAWVKLYRLTEPGKPELEREFFLLGGLSACWQDGDSLWLVAGDGACACGYSRLSDPAGYLPRLWRDGQEVPWDEGEAAVLGEPSRVRYAAAVRISLSEGEIAGKRAFYGDVEGIFHGAGWLALVTGGGGAALSRPAVYSFNEKLACDGRLDTAALLGLSPAAAVGADGSLPDGEYPRLVSVSREGDTLRAVGYVSRKEGEARSNALLAASLELTDGEAEYALLEVDDFFRIGDLLWEEDRAVLCVTTMSAALEKGDTVYFARFDGKPALTATPVTGASVDGVDGMYAYGSPLGWLDTLIPLGGGRYLRYNGTPNGLDLYDLSGDAPAVLYRSGDILGGGGRLEFQWTVYDEHTVGVLAVWPDGEGGYRNVSYTWDVYEVGEGGLTRLSRTPVAGAGTALEIGRRNYVAGMDGSITEIN